MQTADTIYALASAPGKAGVAVFRISGPHARQALHFLSVHDLPEPRMATLVKLQYANHPIDNALALYFPAPHSFTGDDVVELHTHGSMAVRKLLMEALAHCPHLRMAEPGEFARRAFLNQKFDLAQAEGLADLIDAETGAQHAQALRQLGGDTSARIAALRDQILTPLALLEAYIDFPEEEIPESVLSETNARVAELKNEIAALLDDGHSGERIREGIEVVIVGPPNAGKSTLINLLARRDIAIVSPEAGTTRDVLEVHLELKGYPVTVVDTAGLREATGVIEAEGIRRARDRAKNAFLRVLIFDIVSYEKQTDEFEDIMKGDFILALNKTDLLEQYNVPAGAIPLALAEGKGLDELIAAITRHISETIAAHPSPLITRARHREALAKAGLLLSGFAANRPLELVCEELRLAAREIGKITGKVAVDDLLDLIFSRFCIGK